MNNTSESIELSWIGKNKQNEKIDYDLVKQDEYCYGNCNNSNMLIHGDNLGVLEVLREDFKGKIKCIYIDPPYNSLIKFQHYSDKYTHSDWLNMMYQRLLILKELLVDEGYIFVQIDNRELHYLKIIMDEIFGRENYRNSIIVNKTYDAYTLSNSQEVFKTGYDTILLYSKKTSYPVPFIFKKKDCLKNIGVWKDFWCISSNENNYTLCGMNPENGNWRWNEEKALRSLENYKLLMKYRDDNNLQNEPFEEIFFGYIKNNKILKDEFTLIRVINDRVEYYIPPTENYILSDDWTDIIVQGSETNFEHEVSEELLNRIISNFTKPKDIVLDAFLGSATTAAVAQKHNRTWIGIEYGEHCYSTCVKRLNNVIKEQHLKNKNKNNLGYKFYELVKKEEK
ncbi:MAG: site-specific DNA-methyltransferase [Bacilli bacterium]|nr:site-specific DNA-methyltransferase [Bacilli bacterium]